MERTKEVDTKKEKIRRDIDLFFHYLKGFIMVAGGVEMSEKRIMEMTVRELIETIYPNDIRLIVDYERLLPEYRKTRM